MSKFIVTMDKNSRETLKKLGLKEISKAYGQYVFINEPEVIQKFENKGSLKFSYSNKLNI